MSTSLVALDGAARNSNDAEQRLKADFLARWRQSTDHKLAETVDAYRTFLDRRVKQLERAIRLFLTSDTLTVAQRSDLLASLSLSRPEIKLRDLNRAERRMIDDYRAMDNAARQMLRVLFSRLSATSGGVQ